MRTILFLVALGLVSISCSVKPSIAKDYSGKDLNKTEIIKTLDVYDIEFNWFSAKSKFSVNIPEYDGSATANLRIRKDSIIWLQINKLGVELSRILINTDSIYVIDRLNREYMRESITNTGKRFGIPLSFTTLQNALLGAPLVDFSLEKSDMRAENNSYLLETSELGRYYFLALDQKHLLPRFQRIEAQDQGTLEMDYENYKSIDPIPTASDRALRIIENSGTQYEFDFRNIHTEWNVPKKTRFRIPPHYNRVII